MQEPKIFGIIPSRWGSTRFPGKPLHNIAGKPLIQHVWERDKESKLLEKVIIATDDSRIKEAAENFGAIVTITSNTHLSGTDRIAEAMKEESNCTHVLNIQGDEPLIDCSLIDQLCEKLSKNSDISMITAAISIKNDLDLANPNICLLYTSPSPRDKRQSRMPSSA